ncbi:MAG TPA: hypothetical protein VN783_09920, partial [Thermoanaerobaculia bacterium]|nr:hypothetical protein [Thermoanaerobaculia bacterium]
MGTEETPNRARYDSYALRILLEGTEATTMDLTAEWHLWSHDELVNSLPSLLDLVEANLDALGDEHRGKNLAALESLRDSPPSLLQLRDGARSHDLYTLAFALDLLGRKKAASGLYEESLQLFRAAHELFRGGNAALRATQQMRQALTNALRVIVPLEVAKAFLGETDAGDIRDRVERLIVSAWGTVPPQLSLTLNETLLTELERKRAEAEQDVALHERFVRDNIETVLVIEIPSRLEAVREKWEEIGQHVAPAAVRVAQRNLRRPETLSSLLSREDWEIVR